MQQPMEIVFDGLDASQAIEDFIAQETEKLEKHFGRITSGRVAITKDHAQTKTHFLVKLHLTMPQQRQVTVSREPGEHERHTDIHAAIRDAFAAAKKQLDKQVGQMRNKHPNKDKTEILPAEQEDIV